MALHGSGGVQGAVSADWGPFLKSPETSWAYFGSIIVALFAACLWVNTMDQTISELSSVYQSRSKSEIFVMVISSNFNMNQN